MYWRATSEDSTGDLNLSGQTSVAHASIQCTVSAIVVLKYYTSLIVSSARISYWSSKDKSRYVGITDSIEQCNCQINNCT